ncbi:MAG: LysR family transcriptional regulator [Woeseiaceae bacterium]|nr:LysR family transcriptional regulator [Woeseiaceae bacterium]
MFNSHPGPGDAALDTDNVVWQLDWNLLRTFVVIVQQGGITAAAHKLNLKQPTVSNALRRLETSLGQRLVERGPRAFRVTPQGEALYRESVDIFGSVSRLPIALRDMPDDVQGTVTIEMASHVICPLIDEALSEFHDRHPQATLSIAIGASRNAVKAVLEKRSALAICLAHEQLPGLDYTLVYREHFGYFCGPKHRLFGRENITLADLRGECSVSFGADQLNDVLRPIALLREQAELDPHISGISTNLEEVRRMIIANLGIGPLPIHVVERDVRDGLLWRLPPYEDMPVVEIYTVQNPKSLLTRAEQRFCELLHEKISATPIANRTYGLD